MFGQHLFYLGRYFVDKKFVVFGQIGFIGANWLHLGKVNVFGQYGCIRAKWVKVIWVKTVVIGQKWFYFGI